MYAPPPQCFEILGKELPASSMEASYYTRLHTVTVPGQGSGRQRNPCRDFPQDRDGERLLQISPRSCAKSVTADLLRLSPRPNICNVPSPSGREVQSMNDVRSRVGCRQRPYHLHCERCGKEFTAKRKDAKFCKPACRVYANRAKEAVAALAIAAAVANAPTVPMSRK